MVMPSGIKTEVRTYKLFINGEFVDAKSTKSIPVYDPASEEVIAQVPDANAEDVNRAVQAAREAFDNGPWGTTTAQERGRVLFRLAEKVRQNAAMLAELEARNCGKPIVEAEFDMADVSTCFADYSVELSSTDGGMEARASFSRRCHMRS
jgi:betaine-aldehyde dehydrogenase